MRIVYSPSNVAEAYMLVHLLGQEGIEATIQGENLLSAVGGLPPADLLKISVNDEDFDRARKFLLEWEHKNFQEESVTKPIKKSSKSAMFFVALIGFILGVGVNDYYLARGDFTTAPYERKIDSNKDGKADIIYHYKNKHSNYPERIEIDRNFDGKFDIIEKYNDEGLLVFRKEDNNFGGFFDKNITYSYENGSIVKEDVDITGDEPIRYTTLFLYDIPQQIQFVDPKTDKLISIIYYDSDSIVKTADVDAEGKGFLDTRYIYDRFGRIIKMEKIKQ